ncbi:hypothetical protein C5O80_10310 [Burkholderia sp. SRS-46]|nr:hypothetical protein C5O80_10310 [Burkholderia sp. SRS-46]
MIKKITFMYASHLFALLVKRINRIRHPILKTAPSGTIKWNICTTFANLIGDQLSIFCDINFSWHERI